MMVFENIKAGDVISFKYDKEYHTASILFHKGCYGFFFEESFHPLYYFWEQFDFGDEYMDLLGFSDFMVVASKGTSVERVLDKAKKDYSFDNETNTMFLTYNELRELIVTYSIMEDKINYIINFHNQDIYSSKSLKVIYELGINFDDDMKYNSYIEMQYDKVYIESVKMSDLLEFYMDGMNLIDITNKKYK